MKGKIFLSCFAGVLYAVGAYLICSLLVDLKLAIMLSVFGGAGFALLLHIVLSISEKRANKKYAAVEKQIKSPVFYKTNGNFNLGNKVRNGNIYFYEQGIVFISLDEKPYFCDEIKLSDIHKFEFDRVHMNIYTKDGRAFLIILADADAVLKALENKNWIQ